MPVIQFFGDRSPKNHIVFPPQKRSGCFTFQKRLELFVDDHNAFDLVFLAFFHELNALFRVIQRESLRDQRF